MVKLVDAEHGSAEFIRAHSIFEAALYLVYGHKTLQVGCSHSVQLVGRNIGSCKAFFQRAAVEAYCGYGFCGAAVVGFLPQSAAGIIRKNKLKAVAHGERCLLVNIGVCFTHGITA